MKFRKLAVLFFPLLTLIWYLGGEEVRRPLGFIRMTASLIEFVATFYLGVNLFKLIRTTNRSENPFLIDAVETSFSQTFGSNRFLKFAILEFMAFYYVFLGWLFRPRTYDRQQFQAFPHHKASNYHIIVAILVLVSMVEIPTVHLLFSLWSPIAAWVMTGLGVYSLIWLIGDYIAGSRSPVLVSRKRVLLRIGLFWRADVVLSDIALAGSYNPKEKGIKLTMGVRYTTTLKLHNEIVIKGPFGTTKKTDVVHFAVDQPEYFHRLLTRLSTPEAPLLLRY